jgi:uncharacterized protein YjiS (DUF1127 family)
MAMSTCDFASDNRNAARRPAVATRAFERIATFFRVWKNRRAFDRLSEMTDTELADIGLTRSDLHAAINAPFGSDPTARLRGMRAR